MIIDEEKCSACGSDLEDRQKNMPDDEHDLRECPHCGGSKCCMCDMGDDCPCMSCEEN